jgi:hypothetical protein
MCPAARRRRTVTTAASARRCPGRGRIADRSCGRECRAVAGGNAGPTPSPPSRSRGSRHRGGNRGRDEGRGPWRHGGARGGSGDEPAGGRMPVLLSAPDRLPGRPDHERCREPRPNAACQRHRPLLREPRHVRDAFRRRARPGAGHALRARPRGDRRHRMRRRLRPDDGEARRDAAPLRPRLRERHREHPQRTPRVVPDGEHRRRPRDVPPAVRHPADRRRRRPRARVGALGPDDGVVGQRRCRRCSRRAGREHAARADRDADPAGRHGLERRRRSRRGIARTGPHAGGARHAAFDRAGAAQRTARAARAHRAGADRAGLAAAHRIAQATGAQLRAPTQLPRMERGRGRPPSTGSPTPSTTP